MYAHVLCVYMLYPLYMQVVRRTYVVVPNICGIVPRGDGSRPKNSFASNHHFDLGVDINSLS